MKLLFCATFNLNLQLKLEEKLIARDKKNSRNESPRGGASENSFRLKTNSVNCTKLEREK